MQLQGVEMEKPIAVPPEIDEWLIKTSYVKPFALLGDGQGGVYYVTEELVEKMLNLIYFPPKEE
jgi:hypothetical protein